MRSRVAALLEVPHGLHTDDLVRMGELHHVLGTSRGQARACAHAEDFPEPVVWLEARPVWDRAAVERWAKERLDGSRSGP